MNSSFVDDWIEKKTGASDSDTLLKYQIEKVRETLEYVTKQSAFYRKKLKSFTSIEELPFTFPDDIMQYSSEMLCVGQGIVKRVVTHETSGTTGLTKRIFFSERDHTATIDFFHHGMMEFTSEYDRVLILFPGEKEGSIGRLLADGLNKFGANPFIYGIVSDFDDLIRIISSKKINVIVGLPQQLLELSRLCYHRGIVIPYLHSVLLSADYAAKSIVSAVEKNLSCIVYEHYGMTEMCFGGGVYPKMRDGYHLRHNDFLFEIIDPLTGAILPRGECGEVAFTSLNTEAMPLIRYRTGDLARFSREAKKYPVMKKIKGRLKDGVRLSNGQILKVVELEEAIFKNEDVLDFKASYDGNMLKLYVRSLKFDSSSIIETLLNSPIKNMLNECDIKVISIDDKFIYKNTMNKRFIE